MASKRTSTVSLIPKPIVALFLLLSLTLISGCIRHQTYSPVVEEDGREMSAATELATLPPEIPGERIATSAPPTTGRYTDTQPTSFPRTRIITRVADRGITRRAWSLAVCSRPSGDVLAGPYYWPSIDRAVHRPNSTNVWLEPGEFLWNILLLPYRAVDTPPWQKIAYSPDGGIGWRNVEQSGVIFQERE
jgi:hypothetical protein